MPTEQTKYRRLPGTGVGVAQRSTLWLGGDHVLCIHSSGYSEDYKRFYFRDIQAISFRKTNTGFIYNNVLGALALLSLIAALTTSAGFNIFWYIVTGFFLLIVLLNTWAGPTCRTHLRTAVQTEELPSLGRLKRARKVFARLRPLIVNAQGEIVPSEIPGKMAELAKPPVQSAPNTASASTSSPAPSSAEPFAAPPS